jgi:hypothetical protein
VKDLRRNRLILVEQDAVTYIVLLKTIVCDDGIVFTNRFFYISSVFSLDALLE